MYDVGDIKAFQQTGWALCVRVCVCVTPVMKTEHNTKNSVLVLYSTHQCPVDIIEHTCKIITVHKSNVGACHERKRLPKKTVYLQSNVRGSGTKAHSGSVLAKRPQIWNQMSRYFSGLMSKQWTERRKVKSFAESTQKYSTRGDCSKQMTVSKYNHPVWFMASGKCSTTRGYRTDVCMINDTLYCLM